MMRPHVGNKFHSANTPALLLIGESHYFPEGSPEPSAKTWYASNSDALSPDEIKYISTTDVVRKFVECPSNAAFSIFRNAFRVINEYGPRYSDYRRVADDIAFYNFFLRPGLVGKSLSVDDDRKDVEFAREAFSAHYEELKPSAVVFLSTLAYNHRDQSKQLSVPVISTPHPGCKWWNKVAEKYGSKRGRDVLAEFIKKTSWPAQPYPM